MIEYTKAKKGMRVEVQDVKRNPIGRGTIVKVDKLIVEETGEVLSNNYPTIELDFGGKVTGLDCWWYPVIETEQRKYEGE